MRLLPKCDRMARELRWMFAAKLDIRDLAQAGAVGLVKAGEAFRPAKAGAAGFDSYAWFRIRGAIIDSQKRRTYKEEQHGSLDRELGRDDDRKVIDAIRDPRLLADEIAMQEEIHKLLLAAIRELPVLDQRVIEGHLAGDKVESTAAAVGHSVTWTRAKLVEAKIAVGVAMRSQ